MHRHALHHVSLRIADVSPLAYRRGAASQLFWRPNRAGARLPNLHREETKPIRIVAAGVAAMQELEVEPYISFSTAEIINGLLDDQAPEAGLAAAIVERPATVMVESVADVEALSRMAWVRNIAFTTVQDPVLSAQLETTSGVGSRRRPDDWQALADDVADAAATHDFEAEAFLLGALSNPYRHVDTSLAADEAYRLAGNGFGRVTLACCGGASPVRKDVEVILKTIFASGIPSNRISLLPTSTIAGQQAAMMGLELGLHRLVGAAVTAGSSGDKGHHSPPNNSLAPFATPEQLLRWGTAAADRALGAAAPSIDDLDAVAARRGALRTLADAWVAQLPPQEVAL